VNCFKLVPLLFRSFKEAHKLLKLTKSLHGSVSLDSLVWQNIGKQVLWFTNIEDNWSTMSEADRQSKDVNDFLAVMFSLIFNDDTWEKTFSTKTWDKDQLWKLFDSELSQLDLERNSEITKHKAVLGSKEEGFFSCFKKEDNKVTLNTQCKYPDS